MTENDCLTHQRPGEARKAIVRHNPSQSIVGSPASQEWTSPVNGINARRNFTPKSILRKSSLERNVESSVSVSICSSFDESEVLQEEISENAGSSANQITSERLPERNRHRTVQRMSECDFQTSEGSLMVIRQSDEIKSDDPANFSPSALEATHTVHAHRKAIRGDSTSPSSVSRSFPTMRGVAGHAPAASKFSDVSPTIREFREDSESDSPIISESSILDFMDKASLRVEMKRLAGLLLLAKSEREQGRAQVNALEQELSMARRTLGVGLEDDEEKEAACAQVLQRYVRRKLSRLLYLEHRSRLRQHKAYAVRSRPLTAPQSTHKPVSKADVPKRVDTETSRRRPSASQPHTSCHVGPPIWACSRRPNSAVSVTVRPYGSSRSTVEGARAWSAHRERRGTGHNSGAEIAIVLARFLNDVDMRGLRDMAACVLQAYTRRKKARLALLERFARGIALQRYAAMAVNRSQRTSTGGTTRHSCVSAPPRKRSASPGRIRLMSASKQSGLPHEVGEKQFIVLRNFLRVRDDRGGRHMAASVLQAYMQRKLTRSVYLYHRTRLRLHMKSMRGCRRKEQKNLTVSGSE